MFEIAKGHRFFFVDQFYETKFKKKSANALLGIKYFDLANIEGFSAEMDTKKNCRLAKRFRLGIMGMSDLFNCRSYFYFSFKTYF